MYKPCTTSLNCLHVILRIFYCYTQISTNVEKENVKMVIARIHQVASHACVHQDLMFHQMAADAQTMMNVQK